MGTLSVRENISFSAALRLPKSTSARQRAEKVETVINELGLSHVATTQVCRCCKYSLFIVQNLCNSILYAIVVLEITVGHWPFSDQFQHFADQNPFWLAIFLVHFQWKSN